MGKKKICLIRGDMNLAGGGQRVAANLANEFCEKYEVHFISFNTMRGTLFYKLDPRVIYTGRDFEGKRWREIVLKNIRFLRRYLIKNKIDTAISVNATNTGIITSLACAGIPCKSVCCEHTNLANTYYSSRGEMLSRRIGSLLADRIVTLTKTDMKAYKEKFGTKEKKLCSIYNWIDESLKDEEAVYNSESKKIMTVGRLDRVKGYEWLVEAATKVLPEYPDWNWDIYGDWDGNEEYKREIETLIKAKDLQGRVNLMGKVNDLYRRYKDYSFYVMTSKFEGLPMVLLEAKQKKLPIISFDCPTGPSEIIRDGIDGYLVEKGNIEALAQKIETLICDRKLREKFSEHSTENVYKFEKQTVLKQWIELIETI